MPTAITTLKTYFENGKKPTEQEFYELIDAFIHRDDDLSNLIGQFSSISEAQVGVATDKYMSPFLVKTAINELVRLANIAPLKQEVLDEIDNKTVKSDSIALDDPNIYASSKAVFDIRKLTRVKLNTTVQAVITDVAGNISITILGVIHYGDLSAGMTYFAHSNTKLRIRHDIGDNEYDIAGTIRTGPSLGSLSGRSTLSVSNISTTKIDVQLSTALNTSTYAEISLYILDNVSQ